MIRRPPRSTLFPYTPALPISHQAALHVPAPRGILVRRTAADALLMSPTCMLCLTWSPFGPVRAIALPRPPGGGEVGRRVVSEVAEARAVGVHHVDAVVAREGDLGTVGRPDRARGASYAREPADARSVRVHHVDLTAAVVAREGDLRSVGRPDGRVVMRRIAGNPS